jgi:hypothetical protein
MGDGLSSAMRCVFKRLRSTSSKSGSSSSSSSNTTNSSTTTPSSSASNNLGNDGNNSSNKNKLIAVENEKRQYNNWSHSSNSISQPHHHYSSHYTSNYQPNNCNQSKKQNQSIVPISVCILILICYVTFGAILFHEVQHWSVLESLYFCFTALSTIGFGDLQPKTEIGQYVACVYIIVGMAIVAMCFSLIQTELVVWLRKFSIQEQTQEDEIALVNVAITPIKS